MILAIDCSTRETYAEVLARMHEVRKSVFVDRLRWDVPVTEDRFEIDQFDTDRAVYLINLDPAGEHLASVRLLPSTAPHVLGDVFDHLCEGGAPRLADTWEITRLCTTPGLERARAQKARHKLAVGLVEFAARNAIARYTCVIEVQNIPSLIAPGWDCVPLGLPCTHEGALLGAFALNITPATQALMIARWGGEYPVLTYPSAKAA